MRKNSDAPKEAKEPMADNPFFMLHESNMIYNETWRAFTNSAFFHALIDVENFKTKVMVDELSKKIDRLTFMLENKLDRLAEALEGANMRRGK